MKRTLLLILVFVVLSGCASAPFRPPVECEGEKSIILTKINDPAALSRALLIVQVGALDRIEGYTANDARAVLDQIDHHLVEKVPTYAEIVAYLLQKIKVANALAGATLFILGDDLTRLSEPLPVSDCDLALIRLHMKKQRQLIDVYEAGKGK